MYRYALMGYFIADIFWQHGQFLMNVFTASRFSSHILFVFFKLRSVRCTPPCPTIVLWHVAIRLYCSVVIGLCVRIAAIIPVLGGILFKHRRDIASAISFCFPGMYPIVYSSSCRAIRHLILRMM